MALIHAKKIGIRTSYKDKHSQSRNGDFHNAGVIDDNVVLTKPFVEPLGGFNGLSNDIHVLVFQKLWEMQVRERSVGREEGKVGL
jgi:hypothetical protein